MSLIMPEQRARLLANGCMRDVDHVPLVKLFNPLGLGVWLVTELDTDDDTLFGLADLGEPELGSFSLAEISAVRLPFGLGIERDLTFASAFPLSVWTEVSRRTGSIRAAQQLLQRLGSA